MKINFRRGVSLLVVFTATASASQEFDRRFALETVACLRPIENTDEIFNKIIEEELREFFANQSRFVLRDFSRTDALLRQSRLPYAKVIQDSEVLTQIARSLSAESLVRTQFVHTGNQYIVTLDWISALGMDLLATETFRLPAGTNEALVHDLRVEIRKSLLSLIKQVPFLGQVTGRDGTQITLNFGRMDGLKPGDVVVISTIQEAKQHPILKKVVGWEMREVGRVQIEEAEERMSFGTVLVEEPTITRYMKVTSIISAAAEARKTYPDPTQSLNELAPEKQPRLGSLAASAWIGSHSRSYSVVSGSSFEGGGLLFGAKADGQVWLNRQFFFDGAFHFGLFPYSQRDAVTGLSSTISGLGTMNRILFAAGYNHPLTPDTEGPRVFGRFGWSSITYNVPVSIPELSGSAWFGGLFIGVGADVPLFDVWGTLFQFNLGLFKGATNPDIPTVGTSTGASEVSFYLGGYYRYAPNITLRAGFDLFFNNATFDNSGTLSRVGHTSFAFTPSIVYLF